MDFFWDSSFFFRDHTRPKWSGFMTQYLAGNYHRKSNVTFLTIIDLSPSDPSCIFTTLEFVIDQAKSFNVETPAITFDQPLWIKATEIATAKSMFLVIILGGFHLMMSCMESVGTLMKGSGLEEALTTCYGSNTVENMITGKAGEGDADIFIVERALQEATHSIVDGVAQDIDILILFIHH